MPSEEVVSSFLPCSHVKKSYFLISCNKIKGNEFVLHIALQGAESVYVASHRKDTDELQWVS